MNSRQEMGWRQENEQWSEDKNRRERENGVRTRNSVSHLTTPLMWVAAYHTRTYITFHSGQEMGWEEMAWGQKLPSQEDQSVTSLLPLNWQCFHIRLLYAFAYPLIVCFCLSSCIMRTICPGRVPETFSFFFLQYKNSNTIGKHKNKVPSRRHCSQSPHHCCCRSTGVASIYMYMLLPISCIMRIISPGLDTFVYSLASCIPSPQG